MKSIIIFHLIEERPLEIGPAKQERNASDPVRLPLVVQLVVQFVPRFVVPRFIGAARRPHECGYYKPNSDRPHECGHYEPTCTNTLPPLALWRPSPIHYAGGLRCT